MLEAAYGTVSYGSVGRAGSAVSRFTLDRASKLSRKGDTAADSSTLTDTGETVNSTDERDYAEEAANRADMRAEQECDCTEEYGPCEGHGVVLAQREGASLRTADELCVLFLDDALSIDPACLSPYGLDVKTRAEAALEASHDAHLSSWLDDADLSDELRNVVGQVESYLDAWTFWDDGYRIVQPSSDCPLLDAL